MARGHAKGSQFERDICRLLSEWWSGGKRDDIFWRSDSSGGRATTRMKQGKQTFGQHGDIRAVDPIGAPLTKLCTIELKRGYGRASIADVFDQPPASAIQPWEMWVLQVLLGARDAGTPYWLLITKRDQRLPVVFMPIDFYTALTSYCELQTARPQVRFTFLHYKAAALQTRAVGVTLDCFFGYVSADTIRKVADAK